MQHSDAPDRTRVVIQQLLFGYDRGHRLLAASSAAAKALAPSILPVTDWDPRVAPGTDSYVSGRPLSEGKTYALMRTWKALEMPRPGCVWTHVLLISAVDLARISDLPALDQLLQRPEGPGNYGSYLGTIDLGLAAMEEEPVRLDSNIVDYLVRLTYGQIRTAPPKDDLALERGMLTIWSQQWPGLRRKFSFRTAPLSRKKTSATYNFDVELTEERMSPEADHDGWEEAAYKLISKDLTTPPPGPLRRFLWRYGADTDNHRKDLVRLTHLYQALRSGPSAGADVGSIIAYIANWYPRPRDAHLLKTDICGTAGTEFSLVRHLDRFEVAKALATTQAQHAFPALEAIDRPTIEVWLQMRPSDLTELLAASAKEENNFAESLFAGVSATSNPDFFWNLYARSEKAFLRISERTLDHLTDARVEQLEDETLLTLLTAAKVESPNFAELVPFLLSRRHADLISLVASRAGSAVTKSVIERLAHGDDLVLDSNWVEWVKERPDCVMAFAKATADRRSQLLVCRYLLNADSNECDLAVWSKRLSKIPNDLSGDIDLEFRVFLMIQALKTPSEGSPLLLADTLDPVYDALEKRTLPLRLEMNLVDYLPNIGWMANWDKCQRLKIAIIETCRYLGMSKKATLALTENDYLREDLGMLWSK